MLSGRFELWFGRWTFMLRRRRSFFAIRHATVTLAKVVPCVISQMAAHIQGRRSLRFLLKSVQSGEWVPFHLETQILKFYKICPYPQLRKFPRWDMWQITLNFALIHTNIFQSAQIDSDSAENLSHQWVKIVQIGGKHCDILCFYYLVDEISPIWGNLRNMHVKYIQ